MMLNNQCQDILFVGCSVFSVQHHYHCRYVCFLCYVTHNFSFHIFFSPNSLLYCIYFFYSFVKNQVIGCRYFVCFFFFTSLIVFSVSNCSMFLFHSSCLALIILIFVGTFYILLHFCQECFEVCMQFGEFMAQHKNCQKTF